ncbi:MAG: hypothetical protein HUJ76_09620 [Parasporobacterium sp.]|nr:hypothetical protein [Parasporobacterium sp.]
MNKRLITRKSIMKIILTVIAACFIFATCTAADEKSGGITFESGGFDTPEDAVLAYLDYFRQGDVTGMISTFAIETQVKNTDKKACLQRLKYVTFEYTDGFGYAGTYSYNMAVWSRASSLIRIIDRQLIYYTALLSGYPEMEIGSITLIEDEEIDKFSDYTSLSLLTIESLLPDMQFLCWEPMGTYKSSYERIMNNYSEIVKTNYGADDVCDLAARIQLGDMAAVQYMQCIKYDGKWYNYTPMGTLANIAGLNTCFGGLVIEIGG